MKLFLALLSALHFTSCIRTAETREGTTVPSERRSGHSIAEAGTSVDVAKADLRRRGIDPAEKKMTIAKSVSGKEYFEEMPKNNYWATGRQKVGGRAVDLIVFTEHNLTLGGVHQYFFEAGTNKLLWVARGA